MLRAAFTVLWESPRRVRVTFPFDRLTFASARLAFPDTLGVDASEVILDLRTLRFVNPFGLVYLYWYVRQLLGRGAARVVVSLTCDDLCNWLCRMDFPDLFASESERVVFEPDLRLRRLRRLSLEHRLMEATACDLSRLEDVEDATVRLMEVVDAQCPDLAPLRYQLQESFSELLDNVRQHARCAIAVVAIQTYDRRREVQVAVGDGGIGIKNSLGPQVESLSASQAIERALQEGVTGSPFGGGMGLPELLDEIGEVGKRMAIQSWDGQVIAFGLGRVAYRADDCRCLPGTFVELVWKQSLAAGS